MITPNTLPPQHPAENDAAEAAEEIGHPTVVNVHRWTTALQQQIDAVSKPQGSEELQELTERLLDTAWKSAQTKAKSRQQHQTKAICRHTDEWKSAE